MYNLTPTVKNLLIINLIMFGVNWACISMGIKDLNHYLGLHYFGQEGFKLYQIVTNFFMHAGLAHIVFNMVALYSIGMLLERFWGSKRLLNFYLICGIGASMFHLLIQAIVVYKTYGHFMISNEEAEFIGFLFNGQAIQAVGASGAIFGLFTAVALLFPNTEFFIYFIPIPIKAKYLWTFLVIVDILLGMANFSGDNVAHFAHLGGVVTGYILVKYYNKSKTRFY